MDLKDQTQEVCSDESPSSGIEAELVDWLGRSLADLSEGVRSPEPEKAEPVIQFALTGLRDTLETVRSARPDLALKCVDLRDRLGRFLEPSSDTPEEPDLFGNDNVPV
jgi:hypothetical protein